MPKISVIIVTYNAMKWAERCFVSLRNSSEAIQTIVVDNGSADGSQEFIQKNFPEIDFIQSPKNLGFGKANNIGIEKAYKKGTDFFYLMNQDAWLYQDSIKNLISGYENHPKKEEIGILSPMHLDGSEKLLDIFLDKYIAHNFETTRLISDLYFQKLKPFYELNFINAAHWLLPKKTIETVGGFNPYFFHYGEDIEYANRIHFHQKKILLIPDSKVVHDGKQILGKVDSSRYPDLGIETKIMNPNLPNAIILEKKSLRQSIMKSLLTGNRSLYKAHQEKYNKILKEEKKLTDLQNKVKEVGLTFLNV
ncbi:glycosyltransferase family 2 protein [Chryseobacterium wangxinyae]|uniref:glycosyltransferase family 2 protein n=1 Tax=Chryseobacterium sp. CY353 TaxID=2997334 RepID=UPI00226DB305|nr:glycosyltransferase family 2 protein [Chryseobacterium sp. CY353]MCY0969558.1 glycosyltransferase family 2 protein [Chryseobacterium sp. CY353]